VRSSEGYDTAQICLNGHWISGSFHDFPQFRQAFCKECGAGTVTSCANCGAEIQGHYRGSMSTRHEVPSFCHACGKPYTWMTAKIHAAKAMADELEGLTDAERITLKANIDDIAANTPMTEVAAVRVKKLIPKVLSSGGEVLRKLVVEIASEAAAKVLKG
jgi:hypothetical protein